MLLTTRGNIIPSGIPWQPEITLPAFERKETQAIFLAIAGNKFRTDPQLATILSLTDGLPLAIVLLAEQARSEPNLQSLHQRWLKSRTGLLHRGAGEHRLNNLQISIELSLQSDRIKKVGQRFFALLCSVPDGFSINDVDFVAPEYGQRGMRALVTSGLAYYNSQRIQTLAPIRSYGLQYYPPKAEDQELVHQHYLTLADGGDQLGREGGAQMATLITNDLANIEAILEEELKERSDRTITPILNLAKFSIFTGLGNRILVRKALQLAQHLRNEQFQANCLRSLGKIAFRESDNDAARQLFQQAMPLYDKIGSLLGQANCLRSLGDIAFIESDNDAARQLFQQAMPLYDKIGDLLGQANCLRSLGKIAFIESDNDAARQLFQQAMPLYDKIGDLLGQANCLRSLGDIAFIESDNDAARQLFQQAMPLYDKIGDLLGQANCLSSLGKIAFRESDNDAARQLFQQAMPLYDKIGDLLGQANCLRSLGDIAFIESDNDAARQLFQQAMPLYDKIGSLLGQANCLRSLGDIAFIESDNDAARQLFNKPCPCTTKSVTYSVKPIV